MEQTRRLLRAAERAGQTGAAREVRDRAVVSVLLLIGLRIGELAALDVTGVAVSARKGLVTVRRGKGDRYRQVPLHPDARAALDGWLTARRPAGQRRPGVAAVAAGRQAVRPGGRPDRPPARPGRRARGVRTHPAPHLPDPAGPGRPGHRAGRGARGHARLETTRRYSLPSPADRQAAIDALTVDY